MAARVPDMDLVHDAMYRRYQAYLQEQRASVQQLARRTPRASPAPPAPRAAAAAPRTCVKNCALRPGVRLGWIAATSKRARAGADGLCVQVTLSDERLGSTKLQGHVIGWAEGKHAIVALEHRVAWPSSGSSLRRASWPRR